MTALTMLRPAVLAAAVCITDPAPDIARAVQGDLCNLLQVAASALHLIDRQVDDDLRPLLRVGLSAIRQAGRCARPALPGAEFNFRLGE